jgi:hypothetical protein
VKLKAADQAGASYELTLAVGDRVRLFDRATATFTGGTHGNIGNNGSVLAVRAIGADGLTLRNASGREGLVRWDTLRDRMSGRIRLTYGDVLSIDATQGATSTEHINAMPAGTKPVNAFKGYVAESRHRRATWLIVSDGAERQEVTGRRPLGDPRPVREVDVWANAARNLSRQPEKASALAFLERAKALHRSAAGSMQRGFQPAEQRKHEGREPTTLHRTLDRKRRTASAGRAAGIAKPPERHHLQALGRALRSVGGGDVNGMRLAMDRAQRAAQRMQEQLAKQVQRVRQAIGSGPRL